MLDFCIEDGTEKCKKLLPTTNFPAVTFPFIFFKNKRKSGCRKNRSSVLCMANLFGRTTYIERGESLRTSPRNLYKRGAIPSLGGK